MAGRLLSPSPKAKAMIRTITRSAAQAALGLVILGLGMEAAQYLGEWWRGRALTRP